MERQEIMNCALEIRLSCVTNALRNHRLRLRYDTFKVNNYNFVGLLWLNNNSIII